MSQRRSAPAQSAITTSFTVSPAAFLIDFTSVSETSQAAHRRCWVIVALNGVCGARSTGWASRAPSVSCPLEGRIAVAAAATNPGTSLSRLAVTLVALAGWPASESALRASIVSPFGGSSRAFLITGGIGRPSGVRSSTAAKMSLPEMPSIAA